MKNVPVINCVVQIFCFPSSKDPNMIAAHFLTAIGFTEKRSWRLKSGGSSNNNNSKTRSFSNRWGKMKSGEKDRARIEVLRALKVLLKLARINNNMMKEEEKDRKIYWTFDPGWLQQQQQLTWVCAQDGAERKMKRNEKRHALGGERKKITLDLYFGWIEKR